MISLQNEYLHVEFDEEGRLSFLCCGDGNVIDAPAEESFRMVFKKGSDWEKVVFGKGQKFTASQNGNEVRFHADSLTYREGTAQIGLTLICSLEGEELRFRAEIDNKEPDSWITDFEFPMIGQIKSLGSGAPALLYPNQSGIRIPNIGRHLCGQGNPGEYHGGAPNREIDAGSFGGTYPGTNSMQWMALEDGKKTLYLASYDSDHYITDMRVRGSYAKPGNVTLLFDKLAFVKEGETWASPTAALQLYKGTWHKGADAYSAWSATWRPTHKAPDWIRNMNGYYLVIMKQQYGTEMWPYKTIPQLYDMALENGCDTVGLFGWYDSGHDNQYPDLTVSETLGGAEALRQGIRQVRDRGGNVTLYFQGHLIDTTTEFYKNGGDKMVCRGKDGTPYIEFYNKGHASFFQTRFTNKSFVTSCPCHPGWRQLMEQKAEWVASFGPSGVLYDQIGGMPPRPCFDESHDHPHGKPSLSMSGGRKLLMDGIQRHTKEIDPEYAFMSEHITDVYSAYLDALHGINSYPGGEGERLADSGVQNYPELFRYCFPDTIVTIRNQRPYLEKRAVHYACAFGFRYEMEIRYDADCEAVLADEYHELNLYAKKAADLRRRHWDLLGTGRFVDETPLKQENPAILAKAFRQGDKMAVVLWNDTEETQALQLAADGWTLEAVDSPEGSVSGLPGTMEPQQLLVALYQEAGK